MPDRHHNIRTQHAIGALVGAAVGDALGAPFEFRPGGNYRSAFPEPVLDGCGEMTGGGGWAPGEFTDDTQMALALAESLIRHQQLNPADLWARWQAWAVEANDVGILTRLALKNESPSGAAQLAHNANGGRSAGNGGIMRNTPVALFTSHLPLDQVQALARAQSNLTHHDPDCAIGAALHATAIRAGIDGDDIFDALAVAIDSLESDDRTRWAELLAPGWTPDQATLTNGTVWTCLAQAVCAVRSASSFEEAVVAAVDLGDDADTVACVAGSLAGARWGIQSLPSRWTTYLNGTVATSTGFTSYNYQDLQDISRRLMRLTPPPVRYTDTPAGPVRVHDSERVWAADWSGATDAPTDWAVISACRTGEDFQAYEVRREVFLIDKYDETDNHDALTALTDAVDSLDALLAEDPDRDVVVHCHGGRSRTALILKAWAMRRHGWSEPEAHDWLTSTWPRAHRDNPVFLRILTTEWPPAALSGESSPRH